MNNLLKDTLALILLLFVILLAFSGNVKAEDSYKNYNTKEVVDLIWQVCQDKYDDEDAFLDCADYYNNCVVGKSPKYDDTVFMTCIRERTKNNQ